MKLTVPKYSTKAFSYNKKTHTFATEISTIAHDTPLYDRLYDDACDVGITLVSHVTGKDATYYLSDTETDNEGDTLAWHFERCGGLGIGTKVVVFND